MNTASMLQQWLRFHILVRQTFDYSIRLYILYHETPSLVKVTESNAQRVMDTAILSSINSPGIQLPLPPHLPQ